VYIVKKKYKAATQLEKRYNVYNRANAHNAKQKIMQMRKKTKPPRGSKKQYSVYNRAKTHNARTGKHQLRKAS